MKGRKPTPTTLKLNRGNPGKRALPKHEPAPPAGKLVCPKHLSSVARGEWKRLAADISTWVRPVDRAALAAYCQIYSRWVEAEKKLASEGAVIQMAFGDSERPVKNPWLLVAEKALEQMHRFMAELGITPSSRARVQEVMPASESGGLAKLVGKKGA